MKKLPAFFSKLAVFLIIAGLLLCIGALIAGASFQETLSSFKGSGLQNYLRRNDNLDLDNDALIWNEQSRQSDTINEVFEADDVKKIRIKTNSTDILVKAGDSFSISSEQLSKNMIDIKLSKRGTLTIDDTKTGFSANNIFTNLSYIENNILIITIPEIFSAEEISIENGTSSFYTENIVLRTKSAVFKNDTGSVFIESFESGKTNIENGNGAVFLAGNINGTTSISCGSGYVEIETSLNRENTSYSVEAGMGEISFFGTSFDGSGKVTSGAKKTNHFSLKCGSGRISIKKAEQSVR